MKISEIYHQRAAQREPVISLEIFPPKKAGKIETIYDTLDQLGDIEPDFVSVSYGAGGSTVDYENSTLKIASNIKNKHHIETLHHLTGITNHPADIQRILADIKSENIENVLALRGDLPAGVTQPHGYRYAKDLIADIRQSSDLAIGAATYPEGHIDAPSTRENIEHFRQKEDAGADFFISQLFFDNNAFYNLLDQARAGRVKSPIAAGIMPLLTKSQIERVILFGASLPIELIKIIHKYEDDPAGLRAAGLEFAFKQIDELLDYGVNGIHLYTMNRPAVAREVLARYQHAPLQKEELINGLTIR